MNSEPTTPANNLLETESKLKQDADESKLKQDADDFKQRIAHFNKLTDMTKFISKQPKNIHIHIKNLIQTNEPHLLNDSNSGININISELTMSTFDLIQEYITHIKGQNTILENESNASASAAAVC